MTYALIRHPVLEKAGLPTANQVEALFLLASAALPGTTDGEKYREEFGRALLYSIFSQRKDVPDERFAATYWLNQAREFLSRHGFRADLSLRSLTCAIVASGIPYLSLQRWPLDLGFGLVPGDRAQPSTAWREVLEAGKVPEPAAPKRPRPPRRNTQLEIRRSLPPQGPSFYWRE